ncbi:hypothetical protein EYF80_038172 [Liparis tanakae]|uniref:Uncharacterized protein n=1 Tax=Liparis tanakae TaxID=230148 RepID=A0A4Z2GDD6_9TELE|nr:hypothetical protein EYF80_038172 [Liparis tanakae]
MKTSPLIVRQLCSEPSPNRGAASPPSRFLLRRGKDCVSLQLTGTGPRTKEPEARCCFIRSLFGAR